jgi:protein phosphatase
VSETILFGRDHEVTGEIAVRSVPGAPWAAAISPGAATNKHERHGNEDACGIAARGKIVLAALADAHWGRAAAEVAVVAAIAADLVAEAARGGLLRALEASLRRTAARLSEAHEGSEAAVVAVAWDGARLHWAAVGDCRAYLLHRDRPSDARELAPVRETYLGARWKEPEIASGTEDAVRGARIVLASDGLPECVYARPTLGTAEIGRLAARGSPAGAARALVEAALAKGGEDNVAVVVGDLR